MTHIESVSEETHKGKFEIVRGPKNGNYKISVLYDCDQSVDYNMGTPSSGSFIVVNLSSPPNSTSRLITLHGKLSKCNNDVYANKIFRF